MGARESELAGLEILSKVRLSRTQAEVAAIVGRTPRTISRWENGISRPPRGALRKLDDLLECRSQGDFRFVDLFAGIGGTRLAFERVGGECVFTSEWNSFANRTYTSNFGINDFHPIVGDITKFDEFDVPDHEVLLAGFPCQPFSIAGVSKKNSLGRPHGFADEIQGTLFFDVARIIEAKRPQSFMLENVRNLISHDQGRTFSIICRTLTEDLGYHLFHKVMDASPYVPQGRRRIIIIGFSRDWHSARPDFSLDRIGPKSDGPKMRAVLHPEDGSEQPEASYTVGQRAEVNPKYVLTPRLWSYLQNYAKKHRLAGNGFGFGLVSPNDVARTLSARYYKDGSEILVSRGEAAIPRRLTPRECARLMGFPDSFLIPVSDTQAYKQFGNSVVVPLIEDVARQMVPQLRDIRNLAT